MGMYTAYRGKARIKPEYHGLVQGLIFWHNDCYDFLNLDQRLSEMYPVAKEFIECERARYFFSWMVGGDWGNWEHGEFPLSFADGILTFEGAIKNYDSEATHFGVLLDTIAEEIFFYRKWYEEWDGPQDYIKGGNWTEPPRLDDPHGSWYYSDTFDYGDK